MVAPACVDDVGFSYLSGYQKVGKRGVISGSFRYFSLGNIQFTDFEGAPQGSFNPNEFALTLVMLLAFYKAIVDGCKPSLHLFKYCWKWNS
jgi:hypothetical protein